MRIVALDDQRPAGDLVPGVGREHFPKPARFVLFVVEYLQHPWNRTDWGKHCPAQVGNFGGCQLHQANAEGFIEFLLVSAARAVARESRV